MQGNDCAMTNQSWIIILSHVDLYTLRPIDFSSNPVKTVKLTIIIHDNSIIEANSWTDVIKIRSPYVRISQNSLIDDALSSPGFIKYCSSSRIDTNNMDILKLQKHSSTFNNFVTVSYNNNRIKCPSPARLSHLSDTELFEKQYTGDIKINSSLIKDLFALQRASEIREENAYKMFSYIVKEAPKLYKSIQMKIGKLSIGKPHVVPIKHLKEYLNLKNNVIIPKWLEKQSDFYFLDMPFTVHPIIRPELFKYKNMYIEVCFDNSDHTSFELYPISITKEMFDEIKTGEKVTDPSNIVSLGKIFNIEVLYKDIKPTVTSYGLGENSFYWKLEDDALNMKTWRRTFAILEVPKGENKLK